jgi:hypothetical protein
VNTGIADNILKAQQQPHIYSKGKKYYIHPSQHLKEHEVKKLFQACKIAYENGNPVNRFFTIQYDDYATPKRPQELITKIMEYSRKWLQRRGLPVAYLYTLENGKIKGIHAHILIHIPAHYQVKYTKALARWLPFEWSKGRVEVKILKYPDYGELSPLSHAYGVMRYLCKGIEPESNIHGIKPKYQGVIYGKRYGIAITIIRLITPPLVILKAFIRSGKIT